MSTTPVTLDNPPPAPNLYQRIIEVRKEVSYVQKNAIIDNKYRAVSHDAVVAALRDSMNKHGVIAFPSIVTNGTVSEVTKADGTRASQFRYAGQFSVTFINADDPKDRETVFVEGHAMDNGDKAPGKASSYAFKSALLKMFLLETGENEESVFGQADGLDSVKFGANLDGANLDGANLSLANLDGEVLTKAPLSLLNLTWHVLITEGYMSIGCQRHAHSEWSEFGIEAIERMESRAPEFWLQWRDVLLAMCKQHAGQVPTT